MIISMLESGGGEEKTGNYESSLILKNPNPFLILYFKRVELSKVKKTCKWLNMIQLLWK